MKIKLLTVGKIADRPIEAKCADYDNRINRFFPFERIHVKEEKIKTLSEREIRDREAGRILAKAAPEDRLIIMDQSGRFKTSEAFSELIIETAQYRKKNPLFVIGGPLGLGQKVIQAADLKISLSRMTFTHELAALLLLEQIYRALNIWRGTKYHK